MVSAFRRRPATSGSIGDSKPENHNLGSRISAVPDLKKPTQSDLLAAAGRTLPDLIAPGLRVLFCGINPSLYSGYTGHHFGRPGNRFWPTLYAAGFTDRLLTAPAEGQLLALGLGITSLVERATSAADELTTDELIAV